MSKSCNVQLLHSKYSASLGGIWKVWSISAAFWMQPSFLELAIYLVAYDQYSLYIYVIKVGEK